MTTSREQLPGSAAGPGTESHRSGWETLVRPAGWALWRLPRGPLALVLGVQVGAMVACVLALVLRPNDARDWVVVGLLFVGSVVHAEASRHIERVRLSVRDRPFIDLKSMWTFAGLLLAQVGPALVLVTATFAYWGLRNEHRPTPHRWVYSWASVVLATCAASLCVQGADIDTLLEVVAGPAGLLAVALAACVRWLVNHGLVVVIIMLLAPSPAMRRHLANPTDTLLGLGALALGAALAVLAAASPWLVPILLVPVIVLHRGVLVDQFRNAARTDAKTGLANGPSWAEATQKEIARARRHGTGLAVLMVDLDNFKAINDAHGHLAGDEVLRAVASALSTEVRGYDAVGRFGGEEFVVLLSEVDRGGATLTAERIRRRIHGIDVTVAAGGGATSRIRGLTASIGCVTTVCPVDTTVDALINAADSALYCAKRAGRDRTVCA